MWRHNLLPYWRVVMLLPNGWGNDIVGHGVSIVLGYEWKRGKFHIHLNVLKATFNLPHKVISESINCFLILFSNQAIF
jgi:hypothetical protein